MYNKQKRLKEIDIEIKAKRLIDVQLSMLLPCLEKKGAKERFQKRIEELELQIQMLELEKRELEFEEDLALELSELH